jgi:hypothetical protein
MSEGLEMAYNTLPVDPFIQARMNIVPPARQKEYLDTMEHLGRAATLLSAAETVARDTRRYGEDYRRILDDYNAALVARVVFGEKLAGLQYS